MPLRVRALVKTCDSCPAQWEGWTHDGRRVYVRFRWGLLRVRVGAAGDESEYAAVEGEEVFVYQGDDIWIGYLEYEGLKRLTAGVIDWPTDETPRMDRDRILKPTGGIR